MSGIPSAAMRDLDAEHLECDIGHRCQDTSEGNCQCQATTTKAILHKVGCSDITALFAYGPESGHQDKDKRIDEDGIRDGEETADSSGQVHRARYSDKGVSGIEVAAEQEPGDKSAEASSGQAPLVREDPDRHVASEQLRSQEL